MAEKYTSQRMISELPHPMINFLWYLWEVYYIPTGGEFRITLSSTGDLNNQVFVIHTTDETITQNFNCAVNAGVVVRKCGQRYFMEYL